MKIKARITNLVESPPIYPITLFSKLILVIAFSVIVLTTVNAGATVMKYADITELINISDVIVYGRVVQQETYFDKTKGHVVTDTKLKVQTPFYGKVGEEVIFQQWGGQYQDMTHHISGDATFSLDEEVIVFLHRDNLNLNGTLYLSALAQSKYTVRRNTTGQAIVVRDISDIVFLVEGSNGSSMAHGYDAPADIKTFTGVLRDQIRLIKGGQ